MVSIILTAWKEERTVGKAVEQILGQISEINDSAELILVCPDEETYRVAQGVVRKQQFRNFVYMRDPQKGKPHALNLAMRKAKGTIIISTDGDVWVADGALMELVKPFADPLVGGVGGRPMCSNERKSMWGYWGHLFIDSAHRRRLDARERGEFFPMSGYLLAMRNKRILVPDEVLDDVYYSYWLHERGYTVAYAPKATVYVKQPSTYHGWMMQKVRSIVGFRGIVQQFPKNKPSRSFSDDLRYALFPIRYATSLRELIWSVLLYPQRLWLWLSVWYQMHIFKKSASALWKRDDYRAGEK